MFSDIAMPFFVVSIVAGLLLSVEAESGCDFQKYHKESPEELKAFQKIKPLIGKRFTVKDQESKFEYQIGICISAKSDPSLTQYDQDGVMQWEKNDTKWTFLASIGKISECQIMDGTDWVLLEYGGGKKYGSHCGFENRRALLMFTCDETVAADNPEIIVVGENKEKTSDCFYLFEISTDVVCQSNNKPSAALSFGSIVIIIFFTVIVLYLILGFSYNRFVLGAKGLEQIPNYSFWQDFGNLEADGCSLICRSRTNSGPKTYKGIGDDQLQAEEERDDNLLPM